jgi:putative tricarboxylic transport membrane protein
VKKAKTAQNTTSLAPVIFIFCFTIGYIITGYTSLEEDSRHVPLLTGYITIFLLILETLKRFMPGESTEQSELSSEEEINVPISREITGLLYAAGLGASIYFLGFYIAIPIYLFLAVAYLGNQVKRTAVTISVIGSVIIYVVFELLLEIRLYEGLFFS